jgi:hypothetical protein
VAISVPASRPEVFVRAFGSLACATLLGCSGYFGDLSERSDAGCYPQCRDDEEVGFVVIRPYVTQPSQLDVEVCRGVGCDPVVRLAVRDASLAPTPVLQEGFEYSARIGGDLTPGTFMVHVNCATCPSFNEGDVFDFTIDDPDGDGHWATRATLSYVTIESGRNYDVEQDCPDVARRTCQELRPMYPDSD